ncbi:uncharacterized protein EV420DRAFT_1651169 [Desarmillaria tabescens]|uniref:Nephrocystin 3-like N-terminal domain-containing protein n=1 Tax=Armillaria tabescens TaxID=1929756 RepID=A0AA39MLS9_ARMTA|nr:uncharacterized protein EV420DRAFT_1651169 [Desarmillaria tabescens]KAK0439022.1 hypothetical protein EV420DRAFT_1651169 [Desarmillaria tabescens]
MAEALGITSSITALIGNVTTVIKYVKGIKKVPEECTKLLMELKHTDKDPWLATLLKLGDTFTKLTEILDGLKKKLEDAWRKKRHRVKWPFTKGDIKEDLRKIERIKTLIMRLSLVYNDVKCVGEEILDIEKQKQMDHKTEKVAEWLTSSDHNIIQHDKLMQHVGNTGQWFLESSKFKSWVNGSGMSSYTSSADAGKTILALISVDHLQSLKMAQTLVLNLFFDYNHAAEQTVVNVLHSLLKQRVQACGLSTLITDLHEKSVDAKKNPSHNDLIKCLSEELKSFHHVYIVLDALDEFSTSDDT